MLFALTWLTFSAAQAQTTNYALGTTNLLVGPAAGTNSVVLAVTPATGTWTAVTNAFWLHLSTPNQSGTGSTNIIFSYDANPGATRLGTLTIAGQILTVTQAGTNYVAAQPVTALVSTGLHWPFGVAVDVAGNIYVADTINSAIKEWTASNNTITTLVSSNLYDPQGIAVDAAGNVYFADTGNNAIKVWTPGNGTVTTIISSNLNLPDAVAVDISGNVYIADTGNDAIKEWSVTNNGMTTLVSTGLSNVSGVAVDLAGNVYIADSGNNTIKEWSAANSNVTTLVASGVLHPFGVAVDGAGSVYAADSFNGAIKKWTASSHLVTTLVASNLSGPQGVAVDGGGDVYIADTHNNLIKELPYAFVNPTDIPESLAAGNDTLPAVLPLTANALFAFNPPFSDQSWLTISGATNGVVSFSFTTNSGSSRTAQITVLGQLIPVTQGGVPAILATTALLVGPASGSNSVVLAVTPKTGTWAATANTIWLHLSPANQVGTGSTNVVFSYDSNPGATRYGTLTISGQTLTVTQAGSTYVAAGSVTSLVSSGLNQPQDVAVDGAGNVYIADPFNYAIKEWTLTNNNVSTLVSLATQKEFAVSVTVDQTGNIYFATYGNIFSDPGEIYKWTSVNNNFIKLASSGLKSPSGVAVDTAGNVYIEDTGHQAIKEWTAANGTVTSLVSSGLNGPIGTAVDVAGNVYICDTGNNAIKEWTAANNSVNTLVSLGATNHFNPEGVAVDVCGNVYIGGNQDNAITKWTAANSTATTLISSGLRTPTGLIVDSMGNLYFADTGNNAVKELPYAFVDPTAKVESPAAGNDALPAVLPAAVNLLPPFAPTSDQPWLTITGVTNGVVSFSFTASASNRTANITLLGMTIPILQGVESFTYSLSTNVFTEGAYAGSNNVYLTMVPNGGSSWTASANAPWLHLSEASQFGISSSNVVFSFDENPGATRSGTITIAGQTLTVTQSGPVFFISASSRLEGPTGGSDSVGLAVSPNFGNWTATTYASWLHFSPANQNGTGSTNVVFTCDANPGMTRVATVSISGQSLTVTQAGSTYVAANPVTTLVASGLTDPIGVAVDSSGNVYIADYGDNAVKEWTVSNNAVATLVSSGLNKPEGVAVDASGNVYIANTGNQAIVEWTPSNSNVTTWVPSVPVGMGGPSDVALDGAGNLYMPYAGDIEGEDVIYKGSPGNTNVTPLVTGLAAPGGVAVDGAGNVYVTDSYHMAIKEWIAGNNTLTTLVGSGLEFPSGVAVDGAGNVYIADSTDKAIKEWTPAKNSVTTLAFSGLSYPEGVTVDGTGNVYIANTLNSIIEEMPYAFVDPTSRFESPAAGNDALPAVLQATENLLAPFAPTSDQSWLTITGITNGAVSFSFAPNSGPARTAHISLLGQSIPITQGVIGTPPTLIGAQLVGNGAFQFSFTNIPGAIFTVVATTNLSLPVSTWAVVGNPVETPPGVYQFTSQPTTTNSQTFYGVISP
jgi:DNA-binding beta-propeller fold protein YncE